MEARVGVKIHTRPGAGPRQSRPRPWPGKLDPLHRSSEMLELLPENERQWTAAELLEELRRRGARRLRSVALRANRRRIWSLSADGTRFNLQEAFSRSSDEVLDDLALIAREAHRGGRRARSASDRVARWPVVVEAMAGLGREAARKERRPGPCCATPEQRRYLEDTYRELNRLRFGGRLPELVPLRLSSRMRSRLGQMMPGRNADGGLRVVEIALNADLMLPGNDAIRTETLVHEMAHVADLLEHGNVGHGSTWRRIAARAGCEPRALRTGTIRRRPRGARPSTRVPLTSGGS